MFPENENKPLSLRDRKLNRLYLKETHGDKEQCTFLTFTIKCYELVTYLYQFILHLSEEFRSTPEGIYFAERMYNGFDAIIDAHFIENRETVNDGYRNTCLLELNLSR